MQHVGMSVWSVRWGSVCNVTTTCRCTCVFGAIWCLLQRWCYHGDVARAAVTCELVMSWRSMETCAGECKSYQTSSYGVCAYGIVYDVIDGIMCTSVSVRSTCMKCSNVYLLELYLFNSSLT